MTKVPFKLLSLAFLGFLLLSALGSTGCGGGGNDPQPTPVVDTDGDGVADSADNCPDLANADQKDTDQDGIGDACEIVNPPSPSEDEDGDGVEDEDDNCPNVANANQKDSDKDGIGDACDDDVDGDGVANSNDNCPTVANANQRDQDQDSIGNACDDSQPLSPKYEAVTAGSLDVFDIDSGLALPTRIKITPDGQFMLVAELGGQVHLYRKQNGNWVKQTTLFYDLGDLGVSGERGLTGLFFGANFDTNATDPIQRDVFLSFQFFDNGISDFRNQITRVTFPTSGPDFVGTNPLVVYQGADDDVPSSAHQIQDGVGLIYEGVPHILFSVGDAMNPPNALDETTELGKILLIQRDGSNPSPSPNSNHPPRPFTDPKIQAKGIRNVYGMLMLPESIDPRRRVLGVENGNSTNDRIWLLEMVDFGHEVDAALSLGYDGDDNDTGWKSIPDLNAGAIAPEGVLALISPTIAPSSVSLHPGGGIVPVPSSEKVAFMVVYYGKTASKNNFPGKLIVMGVLDNLGNQPSLTLTPIIHRTSQASGTLGNPVAMDVDPTNGDIIFADIVTGELCQAVLR